MAASVGVLATVMFVAGVGVARLTTTERPDPPGFDLIRESWDLLHAEYVDAEHLDPSALAHGAVSGMADAVGDTDHTYFLTAEEAAQNDEELSGSYGGIGVDFEGSIDARTVSSVVDGAPAALAGLRAGDRIVAVDGSSTEGLDAQDVMDRIAGQPGTNVALSVKRAGRDGLLEFDIRRALIDLETVSWAMVPGTRHALIRLTEFVDGSVDELFAAANEANDAGAVDLILDLRGNPGGYLDAVIDTAGLFLDAGDVVLRERAANGTETEDVVASGGVPTTLPTVVLVDGDSASSAEVLTAALQDAKRATVVGTRTAGTGTILTAYPLSDGSELDIGSEQWLSPKGRSIWHVGLLPDVEVALDQNSTVTSPAQLASGSAWNDSQLRRAIEVLDASGN